MGGGMCPPCPLESAPLVTTAADDFFSFFLLAIFITDRRTCTVCNGFSGRKRRRHSQDVVRHPNRPPVSRRRRPSTVGLERNLPVRTFPSSSDIPPSTPPDPTPSESPATEMGVDLSPNLAGGFPLSHPLPFTPLLFPSPSSSPSVSARMSAVSFPAPEGSGEVPTPPTNFVHFNPGK